MMRFLVTGGSGFIGTHVVSHLLKQNDTTVLSADVNPPKIKDHECIWKRVDICDKNQITQLIEDFQPNIVIHLAARTDLRGKSLSEYAPNIEGVRNLLEGLEQAQDLQQVIFTSSMYISHPGYVIRDFDDYAPHTIYGESKVLTEKIIKEKNPTYTWSIIRPTSIWGPYFGEPYDKFFRLVLSRMYFHMGSRACKKTYGYIDNVVYQIFSILQADPSSIDKSVFYLGDYEPYDITEWADEIAFIAGFKIPLIPFFFFRIGAVVGDVLKKIGINFPMTSFRLRNMTTDNIYNLDLIRQIAPELPVPRAEGSKQTIAWLKQDKK